MDREYMQGVPGVAGRAVSLWISTTPPTHYPKLQGTVDADVAVVGGGLVGTMTAALLMEQGRRVALVEAGRVGCGTSGHTTAKVTVQHADIYHDLVERVGEYEALVYLEAQLTGFNRIAGLVSRYDLRCEYFRTPFYLFAATEDEAETVRLEAETVRGMGLPVTLLGAQTHPFPMAAAMRVEHQAQFHPLRFVTGLLDALRSDRLQVFENTRACDITEGDTCIVHCEQGQVRARHVVVATQFPFYDKGAFFSRLYPYQDYALAVDLKGRTAEGMLHDTGHFGVRTYPGPADQVLIVSGADHRTGQGGDERAKYAEVFDWTRERYALSAADYHWSAEDYRTPDGMPFIGRSPGSERVFLACGFAAWGMTNSAASALLMSDMVLGREDPRWAEVFDPSRARPKASWREFVRENANVAATAIGGKLGGDGELTSEDLRPGEGALVKADGRTRAAYREADGRLILLEPSCSHLGCDVTFNDAERTWDCPCHGSRYSAEGRVIHGPALRPLTRVEPAEADTRDRVRSRPVR